MSANREYERGSCGTQSCDKSVPRYSVFNDLVYADFPNNTLVLAQIQEEEPRVMLECGISWVEYDGNIAIVPFKEKIYVIATDKRGFQHIASVDMATRRLRNLRNIELDRFCARPISDEKHIYVCGGLSGNFEVQSSCER